MMSSCSWQWQLQSHCYHRLRIPQSPSPSSCLLIVRKSSIGFQASITSTVFPATITVHRRRTSPLPPASLSYSSSSSPSSSFSYYQKEQQQKVDLEAEDGDVVGDCLVFEEGIFEDPFLQHVYQTNNNDAGENSKMKKSAVNVKPVYSNNKISELEATENLVPEKWRLLQEEINITKKERRKISQELEFGVRVQRKQRALLPLADYLDYKSSKLAQLKPLVLDNPSTFPDTGDDSLQKENGAIDGQTRVTPRNPKWAVYGRSLDDISHFFNSSGYQPAQNGPNQGPRKLFTKEEKMLLNRRIPDTGTANCRKWLPLHTLAASGEFYLMDALLKHNVDINAADEGGLTALHKAIICKKQAITNYLLRESANPFVLDKDGATLMHYAVRTASSHTIKILLLYNVDINLQDNAGWTPLHVAVQAQRTDLVRLLLIKGADKTVKNGDGLTPLDICLYSGRSSRTYDLIKLLKQLPKSKPTS